MPSKTGSSQHQTPTPSLPPAAQTPLSGPQLLLRSGCTASVTVLVSDFYSHGKPASFFANLHNATFLPPWPWLLLPPPAPGNFAAWEAAEIHAGGGQSGAEGNPQGGLPAWTTSILEARCTHRAPPGDPGGLTRSCMETWALHSTPERVAGATRPGHAPSRQPRPSRALL